MIPNLYGIHKLRISESFYSVSVRIYFLMLYLSLCLHLLYVWIWRQVTTCELCHLSQAQAKENVTFWNRNCSLTFLLFSKFFSRVFLWNMFPFFFFLSFFFMFPFLTLSCFSLKKAFWINKVEGARITGYLLILRFVGWVKRWQ